MRKDGLKGQGRPNQAPAVMAIIFLALIPLLLIVPMPAGAGQHCGAEGDWRNAFIPDTWPPPETKRQFQSLYGGIKPVPVSRACKRHDDCYGKRNAARDDCDQRFLADMQAECDRIYAGIMEIPLREACHLAAKGYYQAVRRHGAAAFKRAQAPMAASTGHRSSHQAVRKPQPPQPGVRSASPDWVYHFKPVLVSDRIFNRDQDAFEVFRAFYEGHPAYLVKIAQVGTGLIMPRKNGFYHAGAARPAKDGRGLRLDLRKITTIPDSGVEVLCGPDRQRIEAWWGKNRLAFTVPAGGIPKVQAGNVQKPATGLLFINSDFEAGDLSNWTATGQAFACQPTKGDNPSVRNRRQPSKHQGDFWIGTFEKYSGRAGERRGGRQGDRPKGTLRSIAFEIQGPKIGFLIGGGKKAGALYVALEVDGRTVRRQTGANSETMKRVIWDVREFMGQSARLVIQDGSEGGWGHINADNFRYFQ